MTNNLHITSYCHIKDNAVYINGNLIFDADKALSFSEFSKSVYKENNISYAKFFKMDKLCKLAFLGTEFILKSGNVELSDDTAIVLSNKASSLDTDRKHQSSIDNKEDYYPSPAVFVYTLPNIAIGEISIRHKIKSENAFFVFDSFDADFLQNYASILIEKEKANNVLCGWVDVDENNYEAFLYLVSSKGSINHTSKELKRLYYL